MPIAAPSGAATRHQALCISSIRNALRDGWRKEAVRRESLPDLKVLTETDCRDTYPDLESMLESLSNDEREVVVLRAIEGMTFKEVAKVRRESINTIASRYRRALEKLRVALKEESE